MILLISYTIITASVDLIACIINTCNLCGYCYGIIRCCLNYEILGCLMKDKLKIYVKTVANFILIFVPQIRQNISET